MSKTVSINSKIFFNWKKSSKQGSSLGLAFKNISHFSHCCTAYTKLFHSFVDNIRPVFLLLTTFMTNYTHFRSRLLRQPQSCPPTRTLEGNELRSQCWTTNGNRSATNNSVLVLLVRLGRCHQHQAHRGPSRSRRMSRRQVQTPQGWAERLPVQPSVGR